MAMKGDYDYGPEQATRDIMEIFQTTGNTRIRVRDVCDALAESVAIRVKNGETE